MGWSDFGARAEAGLAEVGVRADFEPGVRGDIDCRSGEANSRASLSSLLRDGSGRPGMADSCERLLNRSQVPLRMDWVRSESQLWRSGGRPDSAAT